MSKSKIRKRLPAATRDIVERSEERLRRVTELSQARVAMKAEPTAMRLQPSEAEFFQDMIMIPVKLCSLATEIAMTGDKRWRQLIDINAPGCPKYTLKARRSCLG